ncbi:hypothetical protein QWY85_10210 [Neolewinella lacunae]|uniref:Uncharacterized protein n=1 Tax=Neolewinella lacunae TaxID=1517758 RepID=A0A923PPK3_9BACT|nr:hypothetical protein [Neolewinella lacunae]MBC6995446.1 hypothetical protein [Neolewinella lacunae]MDN3635034.1 hypothetical protein [Neolewinella lacunae]
MLKRKFERQIARLERAGNNDFLLILTGGPASFATHELHQLLRRLRVQAQQLRRMRGLMFRIGLAIPFFMFLACAASLVSWRGLVSIFLAFIPACLLVLALAQIYIGKNFSCLDRTKRLRCIIQQELERRRNS